MKGSDNPFPSILVTEGTTPASPAAGKQRLFIDTADHLLKTVDSAGTVTVQGGGASTIAALTDVDLTGLADGDMLVWDTTTSKWIVAVPGSGGFADPTTTKGDIIAHGTSTTRVPIGTDGQVLTADSAQTLGLKWATPASGFADPTTTKGDLITHGTTTGRKAVGTDGQVLAADSAQTDGLNWKTLAASDVGAVPTTRTVAGHALSADVTLAVADVSGAAPTASPTFTGTVTIPTVAGSTDSTTKAASTAFVQAVAALLAPLASPALTGNPTVPTQTAGTNSTRAASTAYADNAVAKQPEVLMFALSDESTAITIGTKVTFRIPFAFTITEIRASLTTASSSGNPAVDVKKNGTTVFSTALTIDATEKTSKTAATPAVLSTTSLSDDDEIALSVTTAGTGAAGLKVTIIGTRA